MTFVIPIFRNVICPWQTQKDIDSAVMFCMRIWKDLSDDERTEIFKLKVDRVW